VNVSPKILVALIAVIIAAVAAGYYAGSRQAGQSQQAAAPGETTPASTVATSPGHPPVNGARQATLPSPSASSVPAHPAIAGGSQALPPETGRAHIDSEVDPNAHFTHFRVGERNVKQIFADGDTMWVGTSGGVIRYNIKTDDYRLYDTRSGRILIEDTPVESLPLQHLRNQFALVPQESVIFASSALENIRYGRPDASAEAVRRAATAARADEFIRALPEGYDTDLGERGVRLSGGQKQRISIARAILADRPILLLDEATRSLDASSEPSGLPEA